MNRRYLFVTPFVALLPLAAPVGGQVDPDSVHLRNDCRMAAQVLTLGRPEARREWALALIPRCGAEGGEVLAGMLNDHRAVSSWDDELDQIVNQTAFIVSPAVFEAAMDVASDPAAGVLARVQSVRALASQLYPGLLVPYSALAEGELSYYGVLLHVNATAERLPRDFFSRTEAVMRDILASEAVPDPVGTAAKALLRKVVTDLYCDAAMSMEECLDVVRMKMRSGGPGSASFGPLR